MIDLENKIIIFNRNAWLDDDYVAQWEEDRADEIEDLDEDARHWRLREDLEGDLEAERELLNIDLPGDLEIVAYGWNGRWNGVAYGMPEFPPRHSGVPAYNISCIFEVEDPWDGACWYIDEDGSDPQDVHFWRPEHDSISGTGFTFRIMDAQMAEDVREGEVVPEGEEWFYENSESLAPYIFDRWGR